MNTVKCKGCGRDMTWGITTEGARIPLDPRAPVYRLDNGIAVRAHGCMVTHFATCSKAGDFSASKRKESDDQTNKT